MGGSGSGISRNVYPKSKIEKAFPVDIRGLRKDNFFNINRHETYFELVFGRSKVACIRLENGILLEYAKDGISLEQKVMFDQTDCNYGGKRKWFLCSSCGRRCAVIYLKVKYFFCRKCCNLTYVTQCDTKSDRLQRKANKLRMKIGVKAGASSKLPFIKPKFMHNKTFSKIMKEIVRLEYKSEVESSWYRKYGSSNYL